MSSTTTTTGWIWMKGIHNVAVVADPPIPRDARPSVAELIQTHRRTIDAVAKNLQQQQQQPPTSKSNYYNHDKHDDLWILRFLLSHKNNIKAATKAAKATLVFRHQQQLDERDVRFHHYYSASNTNNNNHDDNDDNDAIQFVLPNPQRGVIGFLHMTNDSIVEQQHDNDHFWSYMTEWTFQWLDYVTRTTGRLTQLVQLMDMRFVTKPLLKNTIPMMQQQPQYYPQLVHTTVVLCQDAPHEQWVKQQLHNNNKTRVEQQEQLLHFMTTTTTFTSENNNDETTAINETTNLLLTHMSERHLPKRFGGRYYPWPVQFPLPKKVSFRPNSENEYEMEC